MSTNGHSPPDAVRVVEVEDLPTILLEVLGLISDDTLHKLWVRRHKWLTKKDLVAITGFSRGTLDRLVTLRKIPMWKAPGGHEWRITPKQWMACERQLIDEGLLPKNLRPRRAGTARTQKITP